MAHITLAVEVDDVLLSIRHLDDGVINSQGSKPRLLGILHHSTLQVVDGYAVNYYRSNVLMVSDLSTVSLLG